MNPWKMITDQEVEAIHQATLQVLNEVGIILDHPQIREQLLDAGGSENNGRVQIPTELVKNPSKAAPKKSLSGAVRELWSHSVTDHFTGTI